MTQPLTDQQLADRIAEAAIEHGLDLDHTSADGDNPCKCGDWIDDWDAHWAELAVAIVQPELDRLRAELEQTRQQLTALGVVHACPPGNSALTPCCGRTPFELARTDRLTYEQAEITCPAARPSA
jgi:hypothetical protein